MTQAISTTVEKPYARRVRVTDGTKFIGLALIERPLAEGIEAPVTNRTFSTTLGRVLHRPLMLRAPAWALRPPTGELAHLYLTGQRVIPSRHILRDHVYRLPNLQAALENVLRRWEERIGAASLDPAGSNHG